MERKIAITLWLNEFQKFTDDFKNNIGKLIEILKDKALSIDVFSNVKMFSIDGVQVILFPEEVNTEVKSKNYVIDYYKKSGFNGKLHVICHHIEILKDPIQFMNDIENLMDVLDINSWFGTVTDTCNYLYKKYMPRLRVPIDPEMKGWKEKLKVDEVLFCSHSNVQWMIFNIGKGDENELHFNDEFTVPMFWIIEYLARRRNTHPDSMYFMNEYITCPSEKGVYKNLDNCFNSSDESPNAKQEQMKKENEEMRADDEKFRAMKVDHHPDNNLDIVLERTYLKLKSKFEQE